MRWNRKHSKIYQIYRYIINPVAIVRNIIWTTRKSIIYDDIIFIIGAPRSGTTMMQKIISKSNFVESFDQETEVLSKKNLFDYQRFDKILSKIKYKKALEISKSHSEFLINIHKLSFGDNKLFLEKTPQHALYSGKINTDFPNAKVIHMVRDPRDAYVSGLNGKNIPQAKSSKKYFKYWNKCVKSTTCISKDKILVIRYEDFVANPDIQLKKICDFLNINFDVNMLNMKEDNDRRSKLKEFAKLSKKIDSSSVGQWKSKLTNSEIEIAKKFCKNLGEKNGYKF